MGDSNGWWLPAFVKAVSEEVVEFRDRVYLPCRSVNVVRYSPVFYRVSLDDDVARTFIAVARLSHAADVNHRLLVAEGVLVIQLVGALEAEIIGEDSRRMRVPLKAISLNQAEYSFDFLGVVNIFRKHIFVQRATSGPVHEHEIAVPMDSWQLAEEIPAFCIFGITAIFDLSPCPEDRLFRATAKSVRVKESGLIVIAQNAQVKLHHLIETFAWVWAVTHDIAQTENLGDTLRSNILHDGVKGGQVSVDIANNRAFHDASLRECAQKGAWALR